MADESVPVYRIDTAGRRLIENVRAMGRLGGDQLGTNHWLQVIFRQWGATLRDVAPDLDAQRVQQHVENELRLGRPGEALPEFDVLRVASTVAATAGRSYLLADDITRGVLILSGYQVTGTARLFSRSDFHPNQASPAPVQIEAAPTLDHIGQDLTAAARLGELRPVVGRDEELQTVIEVLLRSTKRNPILVGPPGVGKTALAEGLALRIAEGRVPDLLRDVRLISLHPGSLLIGIETNGELQARVKRVVEEASVPNVVLFIDEVHSLVGMGGEEGRTDLATMLKPALSRGGIACLAATTDAEYRRFIEEDGALERRFQPIRINEPGRDVVMMLLRERAADLAEKRGVVTGETELAWLYDFAKRFLRSRCFPDKAIDLLEQSVANAAAAGLRAVTAETATAVAERLVGMPVSVPERVESLRTELERRGVLGIPEIESIAENVHVRMRGFGVNPARPNAVILLLDEAASAADSLCEALAECLYGSAERIVSVDFGRLSEPSSVTLLVGAPPSYVGYKDRVPLHELLQTPWCVVRLDDVHGAHAHVREVLHAALSDGYFTDGSGRRIHLSDSVVVLTARSGRVRESERPRPFAEMTLGPALVSACDLVTDELPEAGEPFRRWLERDLLTDLAERFERRGLSVRWHASILDWLRGLKDAYTHPLELERHLESELAHELLAFLPEDSGVDAVSVGWNDGRLVVKPRAEEPGAPAA